MHEIFKFLTDFVSRPDTVLVDLIAKYDSWIYLILFFIIFAETGLIVASFLMPFLPGDALIFAVGMISAGGHIHIWIILPVLVLAALLGDNVNYFVGRRSGNWFYNQEKTWFLRKSHLEKATEFFAQYGTKAVIIARFIPVVRTIVPFLSGVTNMHYPTFLRYSFYGATLWVGVVGLLGYFLGQIEFVQKNLEWFVLLIIILANIPLLKRLIFGRKKS
jgi:membrane-associated protein